MISHQRNIRWHTVGRCALKSVSAARTRSSDNGVSMLHRIVVILVTLFAELPRASVAGWPEPLVAGGGQGESGHRGQRYSHRTLVAAACWVMAASRCSSS